MMILPVEKTDLEKILSIQKAAFSIEAELYNMHDIYPLKMTIDDIENDFIKYDYLKAVEASAIAGSVKYKIEDSIGYIGNLIVDPLHHNNGIGSSLLNEAIEKLAAADKIKLFTGYRSVKNIHLYKKFGFEIVREDYISECEPKMVFMERKNMNKSSSELK